MKLKKTTLKTVILILVLLCSVLIFLWFARDHILLSSIRSGNLPLLKICLMTGANPNAEVDFNIEYSRKVILLEVAVANERPEIVKYLIKAGAKNNLALIDAVNSRQLQMVDILLRNGANVNVKLLKDESTPLMFAAYSGERSIVDTLLKNGAKVNMKCNDGRTALMVAAARGNDIIVDILLKNGADVNAKRNDGRTALMMAASEQYDKTVATLLKNGANVNAIENSGWTALMLTANSDQIPIPIEIVDMLLKHGANPNLQIFKKGYTALMMVAMKGKKSIAESLLKSKACPNIKNYRSGATAIFYAVVAGYLDIVKLLFVHKAKLKVETNNGKTLLFVAAQEVKPKIFNFLMKNGANYKKEFNADGKYITPKSAALSHN